MCRICASDTLRSGSALCGVSSLFRTDAHYCFHLHQLLVIHSSIESNGSASLTNCNNIDLNTVPRSRLAIISLRSDLVCHLIITERAMASFLNEIANVILYERSH